MTSRQLDEERIFHTARLLPTAEAQADYLDQICAGDQALRERVEALLKVHEQEQSFLKPPSEPAPTVDNTSLTERPGTTIGRYKLMEQIGEGGMQPTTEREVRCYGRVVRSRAAVHCRRRLQ